MGAYQRIHKAFEGAETLPLSTKSKYILMSDCHRGNGTSNDNFLKNQNLYFAALDYYFKKGFTYIELGDGDELWENRSMEQITEIHNNTFWLLSKYYDAGRLYMLYGNHDIIKRKKKYALSACSRYRHADGSAAPLFPQVSFAEGLILEDVKEKKNIYLTHGHQADFFNCRMWKLARFLVRYVWKPLESAGVLDPTSAAKNHTKKKKIEEALTEFARRENRILITGHTHRPMLGTKDSPYFNTGSCVHPRCITGIEIENRCMTLIKWTIRTKKDRTLYVAREEIAGPICVEEY